MLQTRQAVKLRKIMNKEETDLDKYTLRLKLSNFLSIIIFQIKWHAFDMLSDVTSCFESFV